MAAPPSCWLPGPDVRMPPLRTRDLRHLVLRHMGGRGRGGRMYAPHQPSRGDGLSSYRTTAPAPTPGGSSPMRMWDLDDIVGVAQLAKEFRRHQTIIARWSKLYSDFPRPLPIAASPHLYSRQQVRDWVAKKWPSG